MKVSREEVLRIAKLAELGVDEEAVALLVGEMSRILEYVAQLNAAPLLAGEAARPLLAGPDLTPLRADEVRPNPLAFPPSQFAPEFRDGLFLVPRLVAFGAVGAEGEQVGEPAGEPS